MTLLIDFLCRFGWGLSLALVLTPAALVPGGFFRVNLLVVMGLATFASLLAAGLPSESVLAGSPTAGVAGSVWLLTAVAAAAAWIGGILWLAGKEKGGSAACALCAILLAAAVGGSGEPTPVAAGIRLLSGAVVGLTVHAMLLGHWYLNAPGMRVDALRRMIDLALVAWALQLAAAGAMLAGVNLATVTAGSPGLVGQPVGTTTMALASLRWLAGLVGLPVLLWMSRKTLEIPNTQSATGILYVACLAAIVGELAAQLLAASGR